MAVTGINKRQSTGRCSGFLLNHTYIPIPRFDNEYKDIDKLLLLLCGEYIEILTTDNNYLLYHLLQYFNNQKWKYIHVDSKLLLYNAHKGLISRYKKYSNTTLQQLYHAITNIIISLYSLEYEDMPVFIDNLNISISTFPDIRYILNKYFTQRGPDEESVTEDRSLHFIISNANELRKFYPDLYDNIRRYNELIATNDIPKIYIYTISGDPLSSINIRGSAAIFQYETSIPDSTYVDLLRVEFVSHLLNNYRLVNLIKFNLSGMVDIDIEIPFNTILGIWILSVYLAVDAFSKRLGFAVNRHIWNNYMTVICCYLKVVTTELLADASIFDALTEIDFRSSELNLIDTFLPRDRVGLISDLISSLQYETFIDTLRTRVSVKQKYWIGQCLGGSILKNLVSATSLGSHDYTENERSKRLDRISFVERLCLLAAYIVSVSNPAHDVNLYLELLNRDSKKGRKTNMQRNANRSDEAIPQRSFSVLRLKAIFDILIGYKVHNEQISNESKISRFLNCRQRYRYPYIYISDHRLLTNALYNMIRTGYIGVHKGNRKFSIYNENEGLLSSSGNLQTDDHSFTSKLVRMTRQGTGANEPVTSVGRPIAQAGIGIKTHNYQGGVWPNRDIYIYKNPETLVSQPMYNLNISLNDIKELIGGLSHIYNFDGISNINELISIY